MKKTEKIELRVDHAEKERLSSIAERRGQTVSDVVRDALAEELGAARMPYPRWPGLVASGAALIALASIILTLWPNASADSTSETTIIYPETVMVAAEMSAQRVSFHMPTDEDGEKSLTFVTQDNQTYRLNLHTTVDSDSGLMSISAAGCIESDGNCNAQPIQSVSLDTRPYRSSNAEIQAKISEREFIELSVHAFTIRTTRDNLPPEEEH